MQELDKRFDALGDLSWLRASRSLSEISRELTLSGRPAAISTLSKYENGGWTTRDIAGLDELFIKDVFYTVSAIAIDAQRAERALRALHRDNVELVDEGLGQARATHRELQARQRQLRAPHGEQDTAERQVDAAAMSSLLGQIERHSERFSQAYAAFKDAVRTSRCVAESKGAQDAERILFVRAGVNAYEAGYLADEQKFGHAQPDRGRVAEIIDVITRAGFVGTATSVAHVLRDPRILFNVADALNFCGDVERAARVLLKAYRVDPSPAKPASIMGWELPGFGAPYREPEWTGALTLAVTIEKSN